MILFAVGGFVMILAASFVRGTKDRFQDFCIGAALPIFVLMLLPFADAIAWLRPETIDGALRHADLLLGLDGFAVSRWMLRTGIQQSLAAPLYEILPFVMAAAWLVSGSRTLLRAIVIGAVLALPFYLLFPAVGPEYAFKGFPDASARLIHAGIGLHPRNCFPSMHFTWALLLSLNVRNKMWRWIFFTYSAAMLVVPVSSGEHYFVDIIAAIPFSFFVQHLAANVFNEAALRALAGKLKYFSTEEIAA